MSFPPSEPSLPPRTCKCKRVCARTASRVEVMWLQVPTSAVWSQNGRPMACVRVPRGWTPALGLLDRTLGVLLQIDCAPRSEVQNRHAIVLSLHLPRGGGLLRCCRWFLDASRGACTTCDITANFGVGIPTVPLVQHTHCSSRFLTGFPHSWYIIYWPLCTTQSATVAVSKAPPALCCRVHALFTDQPRDVYHAFNPSMKPQTSPTYWFLNYCTSCKIYLLYKTEPVLSLTAKDRVSS